MLLIYIASYIVFVLINDTCLTHYEYCISSFSHAVDYYMNISK